MGDDSRPDVHQEVTQLIVEAIEAGAPRFEMPWHQASDVGYPQNARTGRPYRGINTLTLWVAARKYGFQLGYWASYRQWKGLGAQVRKAERGTTIVFYKELTGEVADEETGLIEQQTYLLARATRVFNADQVDGWAPPEVVGRDSAEALAHAEVFVAATGARIQRGHRPCYDRRCDHIEMPERSQFMGSTTSTATEIYYATLLHELTHWTGHESRLDRLESLGRFGDAAYAMEELVAELGAAFLCADLLLANVPRADHAAYIAGWLSVLKHDNRAIFTAASKASTAARYLGTFQKDWIPGQQGAQAHGPRSVPPGSSGCP